MAEVSADCDREGSGWSCDVTVKDGSGHSTHVVSVPEEDYQSLTGGETDVDSLVEESFHFLLEREPKESILPEFDIMTINRYFPGYDDEISDRLAG